MHKYYLHFCRDKYEFLGVESLEMEIGSKRLSIIYSY